MLGERTAEEMKMTLGSAFPLPSEPDAEIRGRDMVSGLPRTVVVSSSELRQALEEPLHNIFDAVRTTLDQTPPELAGDIMDRGIVLTGGGAMLRGLDERLRHETGMPVHVAEDPLSSVAYGVVVAHLSSSGMGGGQHVQHRDPHDLWNLWPIAGPGPERTQGGTFRRLRSVEVGHTASPHFHRSLQHRSRHRQRKRAYHVSQACQR